MKESTCKTDETGTLSIRQIIVALDLNKRCEATLGYAAKIAGYCYATLYVTYVFWPPRMSEGPYYYLIDKAQREYAHKLNQMVSLAAKIAPRSRPALLVGEPAKRIAALARDVHADLIVTSSYKPIFSAQLVDIGDPIRIVNETACPVLVCHEADVLEGAGRPLRSRY
jgi:nucleotide-binding universal stress UspA family protein